MSETETLSAQTSRQRTAQDMRLRIAEEIRVMLARRMMSASELARQIGATQPYISRRLTGEIAFDTDDLAQIAEVFGVAVTALFPRREGERAAEIKPWNFSGSKSTRPNGHPKRTSPDPATRRPGRLRAAS